MVVIQNLDKLMQKIQHLAKVHADSANAVKGGVVVGYTANYALYVHECIEMKLKGINRSGGKGKYWDPQGKAQAKFLEKPARLMRNELTQLVIDKVKKGASLQQALFVAGLALQRASQQLCPVDTGNLKASAFTKKE